MKSSEQTGAYFFSPISNNSLILGEGIFFSLFFLNMLTNPVSSSLSRPLLTKILALAKKSFDCKVQQVILEHMTGEKGN